jgi:hypothetical protein
MFPSATWERGKNLDRINKIYMIAEGHAVSAKWISREQGTFPNGVWEREKGKIARGPSTAPRQAWLAQDDRF